MRRAWLALCALLVGCNAVFGWDEATLDPAEAGGPHEAGLDCESYCTLMDSNCSGANLKYITHDVCLKMCNIDAWDLGAPGDTQGNSLACRITFAQLAGTQVEGGRSPTCENAGPLGGDACVRSADDPTRSRCSTFCDLTTLYCTASLLSAAPDPPLRVPPYTSSEECVTDCVGGGDAGAGYPYTPGEGISVDQDGNTLNCRLYHLESAYVDLGAAIAHCKHAQLDSVTCNR